MDDEDPFLEEILNEAMAAYGQLPDEQRATIRRVLREELREDAVAMRLLSAARPRAVPNESADVPASPAAGRESDGSADNVVPLRKRSSR